MSDATYTISIAANGDVSVDGIATGSALTATQTRVLRAIFSSRKLATKAYLLSAVYGGRDEPEGNMLEATVCHIRRKLGLHRSAIQTVWGQGWASHDSYNLAADDQTVGVNVDAELFGELLHITGEEPSDLVTRLLKAEHERLWA